MCWYYKKKIPKCLGFAIYRTDLQSGVKKSLPAWVGFEGGHNKAWVPKTTRIWPIQKFWWRDFTVNPGGFYKYEIIPMIGNPEKLRAYKKEALTTNPIVISPNHGEISVFFNRGILASQALRKKVKISSSGRPNYRELSKRISQPNDPLRKKLSGHMLEAIKSFLNRAQTEGGQCYCALYELSDPELVQMLIGSPYVHLILSNAGKNDEMNNAAREALIESGTDVTHRILPSGRIGHNKFIVYVNEKRKPVAVLTGSSNWTPTALCGQTNNTLIIESPPIAKVYFDYWKQLKKDRSKQSEEFRASNNVARKLKVNDNTTEMNIWFSPNTKRRTKPSAKSAKKYSPPSDMEEVFKIMENAKRAILFLAFDPGKPSFLDKLKECEKKNPKLFIRGAMTDRKAVREYHDLVNVDLFHHSSSPDELPPEFKIKESTGTVVSAEAIDDEFAYWQKELLKSSPFAHAIIHDKTIVVDPFLPSCAVITGSHNLGFRASYHNDENMVIIRGNQVLAKAYAVHIMDVYDHYRFRYLLKNKKNKAFNGLKRDDSWQNKYFKDGPSKNEVLFWTEKFAET